MPEQSHSVTTVKKESINDEINSSLLHNKGVVNNKDDTVVNDRLNEENTGEVNDRMNEENTRAVKTPNLSEADVEATNEELSLAKEFGAATIQGQGKKSTRNPSSRATLSHSPKLKNARDNQDARALHMVQTSTAPT
nr:hypothetical protein CFP56_55518 [Quercus suber]